MRRLWGLTALATALLFGGCSADAEEAPDTTESDVTAKTLNAFFVTQWGPTRFNAAGHPDGYGDCGPSSFVMAAAYLGYLPRPTAASAEDEIRRARDLTHGGPTPASTATWGWQDVAAFRSLGAQAYALAPTLAAIDNVLAHGGVVLAMGDPRQAWGLVLDGRGHYLHHYDPSPADRFGHTVVVFLKAADGTYVIGDPLSTSGVFRASAASLAQYFGDYGTLAEAVEVHPRGG